MLQVKLRKVNPLAKIPMRASEHAGAYDVYATEIIKESEDCYLVKIGWEIEFSDGWKLCIAPRSSITKTKWNIQNTPGIGDADFRGEYSIRFRAFPEGWRQSISVGHSEEFRDDVEFRENILTYPSFPYEVGERIAQIWFEPIHVVNFIETEKLSETKRGNGGYGSTGNK